MALQIPDGVADAAGTVGDTYNIGASNNQFSISIDGGANQVFTLTSGSARTAAQVVTDLSALTGAVASVVTVNGVNYVRIRDNSANNNSSSILVNAPTNNANATLGFTATTYYGGAATSVNNATLTTKQGLINFIETELLNAGWITISGHNTTNLLMQSSMTPSDQNLRCRINVKDNGNNCVVISIQNVAGTKAGTNGTSNGGQLLVGSSQNWQVIANKYQGFVFVNGANTARGFCAFGVPYIPDTPSLGGGTVYEAIWLSCNAGSDTDSTTRGSFRSVLGSRDGNGTGNCQFILNGNLWEVANSTGTAGIGIMSLIVMFPGVNFSSGAATHYRWHGGDAFGTDPLISWGLTANTDEGQTRGELWACAIAMDSYTVDTTLSSIASHNWQGLTAANGGSTQTFSRGTLFACTS